MSEILFRGKTLVNEWVEGNYIRQTLFYGEEVDRHWIMDIGEFDYDHYNSHLVRPETIGQYTGLTDKNGKKIFEGDILKVPNWDCCGNVVYSVPECRFEISMESGYWVPMHDFASEVEIIGNIHDNPELLKGGAE